MSGESESANRAENIVLPSEASSRRRAISATFVTAQSFDASREEQARRSSIASCKDETDEKKSEGRRKPPTGMPDVTKMTDFKKTVTTARQLKLPAVSSCPAPSSPPAREPKDIEQGLSGDASGEWLLGDSGGKAGFSFKPDSPRRPSASRFSAPGSENKPSRPATRNRMPAYRYIAVLALVLGAIVVGAVCGHYLWPRPPRYLAAPTTAGLHWGSGVEGRNTMWQETGGRAPQAGPQAGQSTPQPAAWPRPPSGMAAGGGAQAAGPSSQAAQPTKAASAAAGQWTTDFVGSQESTSTWATRQQGFPQDVPQGGMGAMPIGYAAGGGSLAAGRLSPSEVAISRMQGNLDFAEPPPLDVESEDSVIGGGGIGLEVAGDMGETGMLVAATGPSVGPPASRTVAYATLP